MTESIPRILAIDDTPVNLMMLGKALEPEFALQIATSGARGLALAEQVTPELILLDIMMPEMDGFEVCRRLKAHPILRDVPVIFISAMTELETESRGLALGAVDYIAKPIHVEIARQRIRNLVEREVLRRKAAAQNEQLQKVYLEQKTMLENDLIGIVKTVNRTIQWANPAFENMLGYSPGELIGTSTRLQYASDKAHADVAMAAYPIISTGGIYHARIQQVRKNGDVIWVEVNGSTLNSATGESLWVFLDVTERQRAENELRQQLHFGAALNAVAKAIIDGNDRHSILQATTTIVGQALGLDRVLIYDVSFEREIVTGLCEWLNPEYPDLHHSTGTYPLSVFRNGANALHQSRQPLFSRADAVNENLVADGSGQLLHGQMHIRSLLWYPFNFHETTFNALALNQVKTDRPWTPQDVSFLQAVADQVSIALNKIAMLAAQAKAKEDLELAASVFTHTREGIVIASPQGCVLDVNQAFTRITGYARDEVVGKNLRALHAGRQSELLYTEMWQRMLDQGHWQGELWNQRKNGERYAESLTITAVRDVHGQVEHFVALFSDITALKAHEDQLEHLAHHDALTNLPNRVLLADRLRQAMAQEQRRGRKLAVVFADLDGFKAVNDTHGHAVGDQLLIGLSVRMRQALRDSDTLARLGGDEFVAVLSDLDNVNDCAPMLTRLLNAAAQPLQMQDTTLQLTASLGVTFYPQAHEVDADQLLRQADQAMYQAKLTGKNRCSYFADNSGH